MGIDNLTIEDEIELIEDAINIIGALSTKETCVPQIITLDKCDKKAFDYLNLLLHRRRKIFKGD